MRRHLAVLLLLPLASPASAEPRPAPNLYGPGAVESRPLPPLPVPQAGSEAAPQGQSPSATAGQIPERTQMAVRPPAPTPLHPAAPPPAQAVAPAPSSVAVDDEDESEDRRSAELRRQEVAYSGSEPPGTLIVDTAHTHLYLVGEGGRAMRYGIGVGREGFTWTGRERITRMAEWPDWHPPKEMIERQPYLPRIMAGGPGNPLGARAMYLGSTLYRIHGTNAPNTIGKYVSSGCIRLTNEDIEDLYARVKVGAQVVVLAADGSTPPPAGRTPAKPARPAATPGRPSAPVLSNQAATPVVAAPAAASQARASAPAAPLPRSRPAAAGASGPSAKDTKVKDAKVRVPPPASAASLTEKKTETKTEATKTKPAEARSAGAKSADAKSARKPAGAKASDSKASGPKASETKASETKASEARPAAKPAPRPAAKPAPVRTEAEAGPAAGKSAAPR